VTIRWGESELRFRISLAELNELQAGRALRERLALSPWAFELCPGPDTQLTATPEDLCLRVAREVLDRLAEGRSRQGYCTEISGVQVSVQVDLRSRQ
jgi:hypothetical protein